MTTDSVIMILEIAPLIIILAILLILINISKLVDKTFNKVNYKLYQLESRILELEHQLEKSLLGVKNEIIKGKVEVCPECGGEFLGILRYSEVLQCLQCGYKGDSEDFVKEEQSE